MKNVTLPLQIQTSQTQCGIASETRLTSYKILPDPHFPLYSLPKISPGYNTSFSHYLIRLQSDSWKSGDSLPLDTITRNLVYKSNTKIVCSNCNIVPHSQFPLFAHRAQYQKSEEVHRQGNIHDLGTSLTENQLFQLRDLIFSCICSTVHT